MPGDGAGLLLNPGAVAEQFKVMGLILLVILIGYAILHVLFFGPDERKEQRKREQEIDRFSEGVDARREQWLRERGKL